MIPVCVLVKYKGSPSAGYAQIWIDGVLRYSWNCVPRAAGDMANFLNNFWSYMGSKVMHLDVNYDIEEPPLC